MKNALAELFSSKKFLVALAGMIAMIAGHWGLHIDPDKLVELVLSPLALYVVAQGLADHGSTQAKVTGESLSTAIDGFGALFEQYRATMRENADRADQRLRDHAAMHASSVVFPPGTFAGAPGAMSGAGTPTVVVTTVPPTPEPPKAA